MSNPLSSPEDIINAALGRIGYRARIGSVWDGSDAAKAALDIYAQTRDDLLRDGEWDFCQRTVTLTLLKAMPAGGYFNAAWDPATNPPFNWQFEYGYPDDCLKVRQVDGPPGFPVDLDPQPSLSWVANDSTYTPARRVILCNIASAILFYAARVSDPLTWPVDFAEALIAALARRLSPLLANLDAEKIEAMDEQRSTGMAAMEQG